MSFVVHPRYALKGCNTFGIAAVAERFIRVCSSVQLQELFQFIDWAHTPWRILGGGSNVLFVRPWLPGVTLHIALPGIEVEDETPDHIHLRVGAGVNWHHLVGWTVAQGWGGIENLALIPGSVGAAPVQNIGAYGVELRSVLEEVEAFDLRSGVFRRFRPEACAFGYRESLFKRALRRQVVITSVRLRLQRNPVLQTTYASLADELKRTSSPPSVRRVYEAVCRIRRSKLPDPRTLGNAGSFFKNPVLPQTRIDRLRTEYPALPVYAAGPGRGKVAAGWLIEQCGWRGHRRGDAGVHEKHALVLVNYGQATGAELLSLARDMEASVLDTFGITLEREVQVME